MVKVRDVSILQEYFEKIYHFSRDKMNADRSQEEAVHNFLDEFTSEVSIHLLLVVQF